ncbi:hypothetical protein Xmau_04360 [Xenorhabdus mauleonii]|uniref:Uncharacterized protein n=1 Tax=Xenorhabdus mauleonii TaxID=351675 RepID=A0A1I3Y8U2_9GAMM|nr:hypothetical protein [Xenorhabdus mauleonii]PHM36079.1 hypothetical protein Xmau_04360 [Xenorhabdus mauleonii]SFK28294.1 hypothetical protein SAMN05421680_1477 [Xenorhabdus mauleonii]
MSSYENASIPERIAEICKSDTTEEAYRLYRQYLPFMKNYKFVFGTGEGGVPGYAVNRTFSAGAAIRSLFNTERVFVLDPETCRDMESGTATYPFDYSISLDTQAASHLIPYLSGKEHTSLPKDLTEVFEFLIRNDVQIDPQPYISENYLKLGNSETADGVYRTLKAYEELINIDVNWFKQHGEVRSTLTEHELTMKAQQHLSTMYKEYEDKSKMNGLFFRHQCMYVLLLKMAAIQLKSPRTSLKNKLSLFLQFCDDEMASLFVRETILAKVYFERGQEFDFFGKIQKNKGDLLVQLANMAWDLWHIRQMEEMMTFTPSKEARYLFPALLTFDKRLIEVIDLYPMKSIAYNVVNPHPMPFYSDDWINFFSPDQINITLDIARYFSEESRASRNARRYLADAQLPEIASRLEAELLQL